MPTRDQLYQALKRADAAGDTAAARAIAQRLAGMKAEPVKVEQPKTGGELAMEGMGDGERLLASIGRGAVDVGDSIGQMFQHAAASPLNPINAGVRMAAGDQGDAVQTALQGRRDAYDAEIAADDRRFREGLGTTATGKVGRFAGNVLATAPVGLIGGAPASIGQAVRVGALQGAVGGALQPAEGGDDFLAQKAQQVGVGALTGGGVGGLLKGGQVTVGAVKELAKRLKDAMPNVSQAARERAAAEILRNAAADPARLARAGGPSQLVPGTQQTLAETVDDVGVSGLQRTLQSMSPDFNNRVATMQQQNNAARVDAIRSAFGGADEASAVAAETARNARALPQLNKAYKAAGVNVKPVLDLADQIIKDRTGRPAVQKAVEDIKALLMTDGADKVQVLHNVRQSIDDAIAGRNDSQVGKAAMRELLAIKRRLDVQIGKASPEFKGFLREYAEGSKEAGRVRMGDELLGKSFAARDAAGNPVLSPAQFSRAADNLDRVAQQATGFRRQSAERLMTPEQSQTVGAIRADLDRLARTQMQGKAVGSNTVQNAAGVGRLQDSLGGSDLVGALAPRAALPLNLLNGLKAKYGQRVLETVQEAMLNPQEAARILSTLPPQQQQAARALLSDPRIAEVLKVGTGAAIASTAGAAAAQRP